MLTRPKRASHNTRYQMFSVRYGAVSQRRVALFGAFERIPHLLDELSLGDP